MTPLQLKALLVALMCGDCVIPPIEHQTLVDYANNESRLHGFKNWIDAYHNM
jgi:hypothetical protein